MLDHIQWLLENRSMEIQQCLEKENVDLSPQQALHTLSKADPTDRKIWTQWLCDTWIGEGFLWEDVIAESNSKVAETLEWFLEYRSKLTQEQKNIAHYNTLADVYDSIKSWVKDSIEQPSTRAQKRNERANAYRESRILVDNDRVTIAVPMTQQAAQWWGKGTRWCTAARENNVFHSYHKTSPLIVITIKPEGENPIRKFQLHVDDRVAQFAGYSASFMDESDRTVSYKTVERYWPLLGELMGWAASRSSLCVRYIPPDYRTELVCSRMVENDGESIKWINEDKRTPTLCEKAVSNSGYAIKFVPKHYITEKMALSCLENEGSLEDIPLNIKTAQVCLHAVQHNPLALQWVPFRIRTRSLCSLAIKQNSEALQWVPKKFLTQEMLMECVEKNGSCLKFVPEKFITESLCLKAVVQDSFSLQFVPFHHRTKQIYIAAARNNCDPWQSSIIPLIPPSHLDQDIILELVGAKGKSLKLIPEHLRSKEVCERAVQKDGLAIEFVPSRLVTKSLCVQALEQNGHAIYFLKNKYKTPEFSLLAIKTSPQALHLIPSQHRKLIPLEYIEFCEQVCERLNDVSLKMGEGESPIILENSQLPTWPVEETIVELQKVLNQYQDNFRVMKTF